MNKMSLPSRLIIGIGSLALIATYFFPVWFIFLIAPQYPEGLTMNIWLNKITGQVDIINGLNHYIGMKHINASMFPEFDFRVYIVGFFIAYGLAVAISGKRKLLFSYLIKKTIPVAMVILTILVTSCNTKPQPFAYGKDICDDCKMTIMDPKFGGEIITKKGKIYKFDDAHCIVNFMKGAAIKESDIKQTVFVDYENENHFLDVKSSFFVISDQLKSPMNSNAGAFSSTKIATERAAAISGTMKTWDQLKAGL